MAGAVHTRIAPTPSGYLHRGNAYNFLLAQWLFSRSPGDLRLRIDDLDAGRARPEYLQDIFDALDWLGIQPVSGPRSSAEHSRQYSQQLRLPRYHALLDQLADTGRLFACTCSRKDVLINSADGQYPGTCRAKKIPLDTPDCTWRLQTGPGTIIQFEDRLSGSMSIDLFDAARDFVVRRRDGIPAYHIASLADDADFGMNTIVRGRDLLTSTAVQLHLALLLGMAPFAAVQFYHHPLIETVAGEKLSKSAGSMSLKAIRASGTTREAFYAAFLRWMSGIGLV